MKNRNEGKQKEATTENVDQNNQAITNNTDTSNKNDELSQKETFTVHNGKCQDTSNPDSQGLLYYCVPELGIKFKVTSDTLNDLKYKADKDEVEYFSMEIAASQFYSNSETDNSFSNCRLSEETGNSCGFFYIDKIFQSQAKEFEKKFNRPWCVGSGGKVILEDNDSLVCLFGRGQDLFSDRNYKKNFHIKQDIKKKKFGVFLNTIQFIN